MPIIFVENMIFFFWREVFPPYFLQNKNFVTNKLLFTAIEKKSSELLTLMTVRQKYQKNFFL